MTGVPEVWFRYRVTPRGQLIWPINAKGWLSLLAITVAPTLAFLWLAQALHIHSAWLGGGYIVLAVPVMVFVLTKLFQAKGQQA